MVDIILHTIANKDVASSYLAHIGKWSHPFFVRVWICIVPTVTASLSHYRYIHSKHFHLKEPVMMDRRQFLGTTAAAAVTAAMNPGELPAATGATPVAPGRVLQAKGYQILDGDKPVRLRGVNLGGWMLIEDYMIGLPWTEWKIREQFRRVLGEESYTAFFNAYMESYIAEADIAFLAKQGFNFVRVPFQLSPLRVRPDAGPMARGWLPPPGWRGASLPQIQSLGSAGPSRRARAPRPAIRMLAAPTAKPICGITSSLWIARSHCGRNSRSVRKETPPSPATTCSVNPCQRRPAFKRVLPPDHSRHSRGGCKPHHRSGSQPLGQGH